jgi:hypothetical protein
MKYILSLIISGALVVSGFGQTRNVLVNTNNVVVQPTNFWSADAANARAGLGLGSVVTNSSAAFQPSSSVLTNLASSNAVNLTNLSATNIVGTVAISNGGTGATNNGLARTNLGLGWSALTNSNASTSLLGFTTNGQVVANTGTNVLTFTNNVSFSGGPIVNGSGVFYVTPTNGGLNLEEGLITDDSNNTVLSWSGGDETILSVGRALGFATTNVAATTRTNLGLGATNAVRFGSILLYQDGETTNAITYGADTLSFSQNGVPFFSLDGASGGTVLFEKPISFLGTNAITNAATTRTNLGLGATWLTNTNAANFRTNLGLGLAALTNTNTSNFRSDMGLGWSALTNTNAGTSLVSVDTNGSVVSPTNFWQLAPIATTVAFSTTSTNSTNTATNSRNLIIQSLSSNIVTTTNTLLLPTNTSTFNGDTAVVIHAGGSGSETAIRQDGQTSNLIVLTNFDHTVRFLYFNNTWDFYHNLAYVEPIYFSGTNAAANAAASRTNLGLGATNIPQFESVDIQSFDGADTGFVGRNAGGVLVIRGTNVTTSVPAFFGWTGFESTALSAGESRTNLGLPLPALTNTNNANFQAAVFATNSNPTNAGNFNTHAAWMEVTVQTNGSNVSFRVPLYK